MPYSLCKDPEKEILHRLLYRNKTSQLYGGRELKRKRGQNKSEQAEDKTE